MFASQGVFTATDPTETQITEAAPSANKVDLVEFQPFQGHHFLFSSVCGGCYRAQWGSKAEFKALLQPSFFLTAFPRHICSANCIQSVVEESSKDGLASPQATCSSQAAPALLLLFRLAFSNATTQFPSNLIRLHMHFLDS